MDIMQASDIARKMVRQWGMSERLGFINYAGQQEHIFLGRDITRTSRLRAGNSPGDRPGSPQDHSGFLCQGA